MWSHFSATGEGGGGQPPRPPPPPGGQFPPPPPPQQQQQQQQQFPPPQQQQFPPPHAPLPPTSSPSLTGGGGGGFSGPPPPPTFHPPQSPTNNHDNNNGYDSDDFYDENGRGLALGATVNLVTVLPILAGWKLSSAKKSSSIKDCRSSYVKCQSKEHSCLFPNNSPILGIYAVTIGATGPVSALLCGKLSTTRCISSLNARDRHEAT